MSLAAETHAHNGFTKRNFSSFSPPGRRNRRRSMVISCKINEEKSPAHFRESARKTRTFGYMEMRNVRVNIYSTHRQNHTDRKATSHVFRRENVVTTLQNFVYYDVLFSVYRRKHPPKFVSVLESYLLTILFVHFLCLWRAVRAKLICYIAFIDMIKPRKVCTCCVRHRAAKV
jgi:hypothetical protein